VRPVLSTFGSNGDMQPMLALAAELRRRGHTPLLALSPNYRDRVKEAGLDFAAIGPEMPLDRIRGLIAAQMKNQKPAEQVRHFLEAVLPSLPGIGESLREICRNADMLIGSPYQLACSIVHETTSIPYVSLHLSQFADLGGADMRELSASLINPYRIREGARAVSDPLGADGNSDQLALYAVSRHFLQPPARWPAHHKVVGFFFHDDEHWQPEDGLKEFCLNGERLVVLGFGSIVHVDPSSVTALVLDAARQAGCRMIVQRGWGGLGEQELPPNVYVTGFAPHAWLFSKASLIVHHGGAGTTASALRAGVPSVVVPHTLDQPIWAEFARAKGCARNVIPFSHLNAGRLAVAIKNSLASTQLYQQAAAFGAQIRAEEGVKAAAQLIEQLWLSQKQPIQIRGLQEVASVQPSAVVPVPRRPEMPVSYAQQRLWFADELQQDVTVYNMPFLWRFEGEMRPAALQYAMDQMVQRHEILRTTFPLRNGMPVQKIAAEMRLSLEKFDLQRLPETEREIELIRIAGQEATRRFDLANGPLWKMAWIQLDENSHALLGNMHHIVSDGWSQTIMSKEISMFYKAYCRDERVDLPLPEIQYVDYAVWQRQLFSGEGTHEQIAYWREQLAGTSVLTLPTDYPRPAIKGHKGENVKYQFADDLASKLKATARNEGVTFFMIVLAAFQILLSKYADQEDVPVGTPIAGRTRKELESILGCFINMLTLRTVLTGHPTFKEAIHRTQRVALSAYQNQDVPFEKIVQEMQIVRDVSRTPLFQVSLLFQNIEAVQPVFHGLRFTTAFELVESSPFDLTLEILDADQPHCCLWYASDLYCRETATRMLEHFNKTLETLAATPEAKISEYNVLTSSEWEQALLKSRGSRADLGLHGIHEVIERQVMKAPFAIAVEYEGTALTYMDFNQRANQMARYLQRLGVGLESPVAVCMERGLELAVAMLGIFKAGAAYVPLDPSLPAGRLTWMLGDLESPVVLTQNAIAERLTAGRAICIDDPEVSAGVALECEENLQIPIQGSNAVYIMYTSGSTGKPKAVVATHAGLINLATFQQRFFGLVPEDRVLQVVAPTFDPSIGDCFTGWVAGAAVILAPDARQTMGRDLARLIETARISYTGITPSMLSSMGETQLGGLRILLTGGAPCSIELMRRWGRGRRLFNVYGPTEATICAVSTQLCSDDHAVPIGEPIANVQTYVLDRGMNPVSAGMRGDLYIGGIGVTRGYWKSPDLTADRFVPNPFSASDGERLYRTGDIVRWRTDGKLEFVGRADEQVKIRDQRIELGEIESALRQCEGVQDALVIVGEGKPGQKCLLAYVVPTEPGRKASLPRELRTALRGKLPSYMVPAHFVIMGVLPVNASGKIDRHGLPVPQEPSDSPSSGLAVSDAVTDLERTIASVWSEVLRVEELNLDDNFFDLGGDSFQSIRVQNELVKILGREIKIVELFRFPTVRSLAEYISQKTPPEAASNATLRAASLDAGKERLKKQLGQRAASVKAMGAPSIH